MLVNLNLFFKVPFIIRLSKFWICLTLLRLKIHSFKRVLKNFRDMIMMLTWCVVERCLLLLKKYSSANETLVFIVIMKLSVELSHAIHHSYLIRHLGW